MYTKLEPFLTEWKQEAQITEAVMRALTDESLPQSIREDRRSLGTLAWHLVSSIGYMASLGLSMDDLPDRKERPASAAEIAEAYSRSARSLERAVQEQWSDETLAQSQQVMGVEWQNGASLRFTIMHQAHHRGQMTVLMRQAGLIVPEVYGPNYESWIAKGMVPLD